MIHEYNGWRFNDNHNEEHIMTKLVDFESIKEGYKLLALLEKYLVNQTGKHDVSVDIGAYCFVNIKLAGKTVSDTDRRVADSIDNLLK